MDGIVSVSDEEILSAMRLLVQDSHIFPEPSGSAPLAALISEDNTIDFGKRVVLVISGGNVSAELLSRVLSQQVVVTQN